MRFLIYLLRWIISGFVMLPIMWSLEPYVSLWVNILVGQVFGACIFYFIDRRIFND